MSLQNVAQNLEAFAEKEWEDIKNGVKDIGSTIDQIVEAEVPVIESSLEIAARQFGQLAIQTVISLFGSAGAALAGNAKLNLTATTIVDAAAKTGVTLLEQDVSTLAQNAFVAAQNRLAAITAPAA